MPRTAELDIDGHRIRISNRDKILYPATGTTKGEVIDYYQAVAPLMLPLLAGHALTRHRFPDGVDAPGFYEKNCPAHRPEWLATTTVHSRRQAGKSTEYCVVESSAGLVWLANQAALEIHPSLHRADEPDRPRFLVFDLDPGPPAGLRDCVTLAERLRLLLRHYDLEPAVKLSGGKGLHLLVPVRDVGYERTKSFARAVARVLESDDPERVVSSMSRTEREGRVFIDWSQNDPNKTTVAAWSLRARAQPTVSLPVSWEELLGSRDPERLRLTLHQVLRRIAEVEDPWGDLAQDAAPLPGDDDLGGG